MSILWVLVLLFPTIGLSLSSESDTDPGIEEIYWACGRVAKISGGYDVSEGYFPGLVRIYLGYKHSCTGVLIHPQLVITAAHCFDNTHLHQIHVTPTHLGIFDDQSRPRRRYVNKICIRRKITEGAESISDIGLLRLDSPVHESEGQFTLATRSLGYGNEAIILGHGKGEKGNFLSKAQCALVTTNRCPDSSDQKLCLKLMNGAKLCAGDLGGPILSVQDGELVLLGINLTEGEDDRCNNSDVRAVNIGGQAIGELVKRLSDDCLSNNCATW